MYTAVKSWYGILVVRFKHAMLRNNVGFTLTELICVVMLIGILAIAVLPGWQFITEHMALEYMAKQLARDMRYVQQQTLNDPAGGWKIVFFNGQFANGQFVDKQGWTIYKYEARFSSPQVTRYLAKGQQFIGEPFDGFDLRFRFTGAPERGGHIGIATRQGKTRYIMLMPFTARIRIDTIPPE